MAKKPQAYGFKNKTGSSGIFKKILAVVLIVAMMSAAFCASAYTNNMFGLKDMINGDITSEAPSSSSEEGLTNVNAIIEDDLPDISSIPGNTLHSINGAWLRPGSDYLTDESASYESQTALIDSYLDKMSEYGFNALIVPVTHAGKAIYATGVCEQYYGGEQDLLAYILGKSGEKGVTVYCSLSLNTLGGGLDMYDTQDAAKMQQALSDLCSYDIKGLILSDYYYNDNTGLYNDYLLYGGGMGFEKYSCQKLDDTMRTLVKTIRNAKSGLYLGLCTDAVWAKASSTEGGIDLDIPVLEAYVDKKADTLGWLKDGMFNFNIVSNGYSTTNAISFTKIAQWWADALKDTNVDLYMSHSAGKIGTKETGWTNPDQLTKQVMELSSIDVCGSFFDSVSSLVNDTTGSTNVLVGYIKGTVNSNYIMNKLVITNPKKTKFTTYENKVNIIGSSDPNFPLKMNGSDVQRTENGYFSLELNLSLGSNKFTFEHKGTSITYNITYTLVVIKEVSPASDQSFDGGTTISFGVSALDGATVTATFNGSTINLVKQQQQVDEGNQGKESNYTTYVGQITLPAGQAKAKSLGKVVFKGTYNGITDKVNGGNITVNAIPPAVSSSPGGSEASSSSSGVTAGNNYIAEIVAAQAETFKGSTVDDYSRADNFPLPKGTLDYCGEKDIVLMSPGSSTQYYRLMRFGKRVYTKNKNQGEVVKVYKGTLPKSNTVTANNVSVQEKNTKVAFDVAWKAPFDISLSPQSYSNPNNTKGRPSFEIGSVTYTYIDINFYYASTAQGGIDLTGSRVFSSAEWIKGDGFYTLRLHLKKTGGFYGYSAEYNDAGQLVFSFLHPAKVSTAGGAGSLNGVNIVIDAGHGGSDPGATGSLSGRHEAQLNLIMAQKIESKLKALGANVLMTRTSDSYMSLEERAAFTRKSNADLFVSIHRNSATSTSAKGYENYYFYPFSMPLAKSVYDGVGATGQLSMRGVKYYPYYVTRITDCPSILTENGFVSNAREYQSLITDQSNERLAQGTVDGIVKYLNSIQ